MTRIEKTITKYSTKKVQSYYTGYGFLFYCRHLFRRWRRRMDHIKSFLAQICRERKSFIISEHDYYRLLKVLRNEKKSGRVKQTLLRKFEKLLNRMDEWPIRLVPHDIITMNSRFVVLTKLGRKYELQLVYPDAADKCMGWISILSWLGICFIGKKKGDVIRNGLSIHEIRYQPEARNDFHL